MTTGSWLAGRRVLYRYFGWPHYWAGGAGAWGVSPYPRRLASLPPEEREEAGAGTDPHLRSATEVIGYGIAANDGHLGSVLWPPTLLGPQRRRRLGGRAAMIEAHRMR
jgi:hypothetical protein